MHRHPPPLLALAAPTPDPAAVAAAVVAARTAAAQSHRVHQVYGVPPGAGTGLRWAACPFCGVPLANADDRCAACGAPLSLPPDPQLSGLGRRGAPRIERHDGALMSLPGSAAVYPVRLHDLSFTGLALVAGLAVRPPGVLRLRAAGFDALVQVLQCRRAPPGHMLHGRLLTLRLLRRAGAFVSARA